MVSLKPSADWKVRFGSNELHGQLKDRAGSLIEKDGLNIGTGLGAMVGWGRSPSETPTLKKTSKQCYI